MGEGRRVKNYFALLIWLVLATVCLKNAKKIGLFCRIPFFEVERQSNLPLNNSRTNGISHHFK